MPLSPQRRRRALRAHELRQHHFTIREIADELHVSPATVHDDLRAIETHQAEFARATAHDALLQHLALLRHRIHELITNPLKPLKPLEPFAAQNSDGTVQPLFQHIDSADLIRYLEHRDRALQAALREYRLTARDLLRAADAAQLDPETIAAAVNEYPAAELADAEPPTEQPTEQTLNNPEQTRTNLNKSEHPQPLRPDRTTLQIHPNPPDRNNPEQTLDQEVAEILQNLQDAHQDDDLWSHPEAAQALKQFLAPTHQPAATL